MFQYKVTRIKDGTGWLILYEEVDLSKPKLRVEEMMYKFNTKIIKRESERKVRK